MARELQSNVIQQPTDQGGGNPFLDLIGTFLPMAFGLPPLPGAGQLLQGQMPNAQNLLGMISGFGGFGGVQGINPNGSSPFLPQGGGMDYLTQNQSMNRSNSWNPWMGGW